MNLIVAQRPLLREILDEVLQFQPQARYESLPADPIYLKFCLARRHLRQLAAAQKVALRRQPNVASIKSVPAIKAEDCSPHRPNISDGSGKPSAQPLHRLRRSVTLTTWHRHQSLCAMTAVTGAAPKNYCHSSDYRAGDHHQALLLESAGRRQVPIPDRHNSSTEEFRPPHQDHSHATARCPIAPTVIDAEPSWRERIASLAPRTGDRCFFTHRDRGAVGSWASRRRHSHLRQRHYRSRTALEPHRARAAAQQAPGMSAFRGIGGESPFGR